MASMCPWCSCGRSFIFLFSFYKQTTVLEDYKWPSRAKLRAKHMIVDVVAELTAAEHLAEQALGFHDALHGSLAYPLPGVEEICLTLRAVREQLTYPIRTEPPPRQEQEAPSVFFGELSASCVL
jgi:hypothetical protein